jgi:transposase
MIIAAKLNDGDPRTWLAHALGTIAAQSAHRLAELLPWNWRKSIGNIPAVA